MITYVIKAFKNPCGSIEGNWYSKIGWTKKPPTSEGFALNEAYRQLEFIMSNHYKPCQCIIEVVECE